MSKSENKIISNRESTLEIFYSFIESIDYPFYIVNAKDYSLMYANKILSKNLKFYPNNFNEMLCGSGEDCLMKRVVKTKKTCSLEYLRENSKGKKLYFKIFAYPIFDSKKNVLYIVGYINDITFSKQNEESLLQSEEMFRSISESIGDAIFVKDIYLRYTHVNSEAEKYLGKTKTKILNKKDSQINKNISSLDSENDDKKCLAGEVIKNEIVKIISGESRLYVQTKYPLINKKGAVVGICGIAHDISDVRMREIELLNKEKINKDILDNSPLGMYVVNDNGKADYVNKAMLDISGTTKENFMQTNFFKHMVYVETGIAKKIKKAFLGKKFEIKELSYTSMYGNKSTIRNFIGIPLNSVDNSKKVLIIVEDITDLKRKEDKLASVATAWLDTFDSMNDGVSIHSLNQEITHVNKAVCDLFGLKKEEIIGKKCFNIFHSKEFSISECPLKKSMISKKRENMEYFENKINKWLRISVSPILDKNNNIEKIIHVVTDITERKKAEADLKKRNKDLEVFNNIAVDRELKMVELKKEIKTLKEKIKNNV